MNKIYFICLALIGFCSATAQDISTSSVKWNVVSTFYAEEGNTVDEATSLLTLAGNKIEWQKINGTLKRSFKIVKTIGTWTNINNPGSVRYQVTEGEKDGTILIQRDGKEIKAHILIVGENTESFELTITNAESL